jgi:hypothetical protein
MLRHVPKLAGGTGDAKAPHSPWPGTGHSRFARFVYPDIQLRWTVRALDGSEASFPADPERSRDKNLPASQFLLDRSYSGGWNDRDLSTQFNAACSAARSVAEGRVFAGGASS